jgi:alkylation response protein AidB-like acyl-CoA dehydrogenase
MTENDLTFEETGIRMIARTAAEFAREELMADREVFDRYPFGPYFAAAVDKAFALDFFHITLPESAGGAGLGTAALCAARESHSSTDASLAAVILTHSFAQELVLCADRSDLLQARAAEAEAANRFLLACPLFNNPAEIRPATAVVEKDGRSFLSGKLEYLVLGGIADAAVVPVSTGGSGAYSWVLVDLASPAVTVGDPVLSLGLRCCPAVDTEFDMAPAILLGELDDGEAMFAAASARMLAPAAAVSAGIMQGALSTALDYAKMREQGGRKIIGWSQVRMMLADMAVQTTIAQMAVAEASRRVDAKVRGWEQAALAAAIHVQASAVQATTDGVQILGGVGYMQDLGQEQRFRDAKHIQACFGLTPLQKLTFIDRMTGMERSR